MSLKEELKSEIAVEKGKFKQMSFQDKIWYLYEYYKFHFLGIIGVILLCCVIVTSIYNSTRETMLYTVVINNPNGMATNTDPLSTEFHEYMGFREKDNTVAESMFIHYGDDATEYSYASMGKISALIASQDLDFMLCDDEVFEHYLPMDAFLDLEEVLPEDIWEVVKDRIIYTQTAETHETIASAIDLNGTEFAERCAITMDPAYLSIITNTERLDNCIAMLRYMFDLNE